MFFEFKFSASKRLEHKAIQMLTIIALVKFSNRKLNLNGNQFYSRNNLAYLLGTLYSMGVNRLKPVSLFSSKAPFNFKD